MASTVEQIKNRLGVVDVVSSYLKLEKAGANFKSQCPFHNEKTPSFFVSPSRDSYYCFGCGKKGDIFDFVQEFEGIDFVGSLKILADKAGVEIKKLDPKLRDKTQKLFTLLDDASRFFEEELQKNKEAKKYLKERGFKKEIISEFRIGFAKDDWRTLLEYLTKKGYSEKEIKEVGLLKESKGKTYDTFRSRIMFPIADPSGRIVAFSGRIFGNDDEIAKYINSPETVLYKKSQMLFPYDKAKLEMRKKDFCIIVEGNIDAIMSHQAGYRNTVAPLGTALTREQLEKIARLTKRVVIAFDSDKAGFKASSRGAKIALSMGIDLKVAEIPEGKDPADLILEDVLKWKEAIRESKHIILFHLSKITKEEKDDRKLGLRIREEILPYIAMIDNKIDQSHFVKILSEVMDSPQEGIYEEIQKIDLGDLDVPVLTSEDVSVTKESRKRDNIVRAIAGLILWKRSTDKNIDFDEKKAEKELIRITEEKKILDTYEKKERDEMIFETDISHEDRSGFEKEAQELLLHLEEDFLKEKFEKQMRELKVAEGKKDSKLSLQILKKCQNLSKKIAEVKSKIEL